MQGEAGDQFYIVKEGEAVVYQSTPQGVKTVNRLFKADFFGERALLTQEPRYPSLQPGLASRDMCPRSPSGNHLQLDSASLAHVEVSQPQS